MFSMFSNIIPCFLIKCHVFKFTFNHFSYCTSQIQFSQCMINFQCFTYRKCSKKPNSVIYSNQFWYYCIYCLQYPSSAKSCSYQFLQNEINNQHIWIPFSLLRFKLINVVLVFKNSLIIIATSSPVSIPFPVHYFID